MGPAERALRRRIEREGPISVADFMAEANRSYYASRDPIGRDGDFVTAPEISQMFGELVGIWIADLWSRAGRPGGVAYVELGPGRGTLAADALRAMRAAGLAPPVHFVETSPKLRAAQASLFPGASWHASIETLPTDRSLAIVANEFFDALPVRQYDGEGRQLMVRLGEDGFVRDPADRIREACPAATAIAAGLARRLEAQGGAALIVDYGFAGPGPGDTLQAVSRHERADPWAEPGTRDLTAWVDFGALAKAALESGARVHGPVGQGFWLEAMGIGTRAAALAATAPERASEVEAARERLVAPDRMGTLFKVLALAGGGWPDPSGFQA